MCETNCLNQWCTEPHRVGFYVYAHVYVYVLCLPNLPKECLPALLQMRMYISLQGTNPGDQNANIWCSQLFLLFPVQVIFVGDICKNFEICCLISFCKFSFS